MQTRSSQDARGIDVSHWQGNIHWNEVKASGIDFAYIKATEGTGYVDPDFKVNFSESKSAGILRGAYHFARPGASGPDTQADFFLKELKSAGMGQLPPALDLEDAGGKSESEVTKWVEAYAARVKTKAGVNPVIYVSPSFAGSFLSSAVSSLDLWVADWGVSHPNNFNGWKQWTFWQYSSSGSVKGITGHVDLDVYAGSAATLQKKYGSNRSKTTNLPTLSEGDTGNYVKDLQLLLYRAGQHPNGVTGTFSANTKISVEAFQTQIGITSNGKVNQTTWSHLLNHSETQRKDLKLWSSGQEVLDAQYLLQFRGENPGPIDGILGPDTENAVKSFQKKAQVSVSGIVDNATWKKLMVPLPQPIS